MLFSNLICGISKYEGIKQIKHLYIYLIPRDIGPPKIGCEVKKSLRGPIFHGILILNMQNLCKF